MLGYIALELDRKSVRLQQYEIFISSIDDAVFVSFIAYFGWRLMRGRQQNPIRMVNTASSYANVNARQPGGRVAINDWIC